MKHIFCLSAIVLISCVAAPTEPIALLPCEPDDLDCEPAPPPTTCSGTTASPPIGANRIYRCDFDVTDAYGRPAANQNLELEVRWCNQSGTTVRKKVTGTTGADGHALLTASSPPGNQIYCHLLASEPLEEGETSSNTLTQSAAIASSTTVALDSVIQPPPTQIEHVAGLVDGDAELALFQSGAYDRVLILPEPFDPKENSNSQRNRKRYWKQMRTLMLTLYESGWDIWLFQPRATGDNLHEQSAELAQAIKLASRYQFCAGTVSVFGFNTGGVVARLATARWEADLAWRLALGLPTTLPVKLLGTGDAPNYGMHLNLDMQKMLWDADSNEIHSKANLDSCAAAQLLRGRWDPGRQVKTNDDFLAFWVDGTAVMDGACEAGPALATLNAARGLPGWPTTPIRVGFALSHPDDRVKCYRDLNAQWNLNGHGDDLCVHAVDGYPAIATSDWVPQVVNLPPPFGPIGDVLVKIDVNNAYDRYWRAEDRVEWSDLVAGSRSPLFVDGAAGQAHVDFYGLHWDFEFELEQRAPSTFIPYVSAKGIQGPVGTNPYATVPSPFSDAHFDDLGYSGVADVFPADIGITVDGWLNNNRPTCPGSLIVH